MFQQAHQNKVTKQQSACPACIATNSPERCTRQHLAVQHLVCPRRVWVFFTEKALFKSKALTCWSWQDMLGMLQVQTAADMFLIRHQALGRWFSSSREHSCPRDKNRATNSGHLFPLLPERAGFNTQKARLCIQGTWM